MAKKQDIKLKMFKHPHIFAYMLEPNRGEKKKKKKGKKICKKNKLKYIFQKIGD